MLKIRFEFNGCTYDKFLLVEYKVEQKIWERRFGFHNLLCDTTKALIIWVVTTFATTYP